MNAVRERMAERANKTSSGRRKAGSVRAKPSIRRVAVSDDDPEYGGVADAITVCTVDGLGYTRPNSQATAGWDESAARALVVCTLAQRDLEGLTLWQMVGRVMDTTGWSHLRAVPFVAGAIDAATVLRWARDAARSDGPTFGADVVGASCA
jgi:hypothetical protein